VFYTHYNANKIIGCNLLKFLRILIQQTQILLDGCLPSHCLLCNLPSEQPLICKHCYQSVLKARPCCLHCGCALHTTQAFCGECLKHTFHFQQLHALASYQPPFPKLIKQLKYNNQLIYADLLGLLLADSAKQKYSLQQLQKIDYFIAVPLHIKKLRKRGFNQAQLICDALIKQLPTPALTLSPIVRTKFTIAQEGLTRQQRIKNLHQVFVLTPKAKNTLFGKYVVLIDDVVTTGATINSLCQCLLQEGVKRVDVWCISRTSLN